MKIVELNVNSSFSYLWLKTVKDVDLSQHCARCLIGEYDNRISPKKEHIENIELENSIYYLCGVSKPFVWDNNFHLAFEPCEGSTIQINDKGISVIIEGAKQLPTSDKYINHPKMIYKSYNTCRNWQFANYFQSHLK